MHLRKPRDLVHRYAIRRGYREYIKIRVASEIPTFENYAG